ncbi:hypothetical protein NDU88_001414 [Pleurodeles waltl]|uniref:Uncharacterized protein n=1 Tax=Pleurodeles waltl TaxID=8319 RepID=A0AAV7VWD8_PLEWA|nr:hypothetical protein NDU88_001414 [Pleurodeles waltl]
MRPGESAILPFGQSTHLSPPGARSAIRQLRQSALLSRLLDPIIWIPQPRVPIHHPWVPGRLSLGPPRSDPRLSRTSHPASSSPVFAGLVVSAGVLHYLQPPGRLNLQPCPWPRPRSPACPCVLLGPPAASSGAVSVRLSSARSLLGPQAPPAPPLPLESLLGASRCSVPSAHSLLRIAAPRKASGPPQPAAPSVAATPISGLPPVFFWGRPHPVAQSPCASAVRDLTWATRPPPAPPLPPDSLLGASRCSVPSAHSPPRFAAPRKAAASAACSGPRTPKSPTGRFRHSRGRRGGPHTLGPVRWSRPTAWTSIGPGKARFRLSTHRPLRSE